LSQKIDIWRRYYYCRRKLIFGDDIVLSQKIDNWRRLVVIVGKNIHRRLIGDELATNMVLSQNVLGDEFRIFCDKYLLQFE